MLYNEWAMFLSIGQYNQKELDITHKRVYAILQQKQTSLV